MKLATLCLATITVAVVGADAEGVLWVVVCVEVSVLMLVESVVVFCSLPLQAVKSIARIPANDRERDLCFILSVFSDEESGGGR